VHLRDCALGVVDFFVQDVGNAAVNVECRVHGHAQVLDHAVLAEDLADVVFFDVACQCLDDDLEMELAVV
tara:strand:- start:6819 stop:7028 length:210 start_codon:yes stop_codon:yes gene_type:complete